jgi:hypothetical protein
MTHAVFLVFFLVSVVGAAIIVLIWKSGGQPKKLVLGSREAPITAKPMVTLNEQPSFLKLVEAFPNCFICPQVAFSAMLTSSDLATRNRFNRSRADFVVMDRNFKVLAVVELDDSSHKGREKQDRQRDSYLNQAGYRVVRYKTTPSIEKLQADIS